ncbi:MAG: DUF2914 domain-containing protein [Gammaproteobacteria bacterium]|nr:DUF2914 domain-containing protein [Gammaproteobacteria bacterium]
MNLKQGIITLALLCSLPVCAEQPAAEQVTQDQAGFSSGTVYRAAFTTAIENREPTDKLDQANNEQKQLYFFTELRDMSGQTAKHRWEYNGKVMAEVEFNVKGPRWRVWSSKTFNPEWTGDWKVSVINAAGEVISEKNLNYAAAEPQTAPAAEPAAQEAATETAPANDSATMPAAQ